MTRRFLWLLVDLLAAALILLSVWLLVYRLPQQWNTSGTEISGETVTDWHQKFADQFTDTVVCKEDSYTSPDISIHISRKTYDTGILDTTASGNHVKYGTNIVYTIADIYIGDISCLQTAFAQDTYGSGFSEKLSLMSARLNSVLAVNGDSYSNNRHKDNGTIIRIRK